MILTSEWIFDLNNKCGFSSTAICSKVLSIGKRSSSAIYIAFQPSLYKNIPRYAIIEPNEKTVLHLYISNIKPPSSDSISISFIYCSLHDLVSKIPSNIYSTYSGANHTAIIQKNANGISIDYSPMLKQDSITEDRNQVVHDYWYDYYNGIEDGWMKEVRMRFSISN